MTCREMDDLLLAGTRVEDMPAGAQAHLAGCPKCRALAGVLAPGVLDPEMVERIRKPVLASLHPVRPLPGGGVLTLVFLALFGCMTVAGASVLGFAGLDLLSPLGRLAIYGLLLVLSAAAAFAAASGMRPGARSIPGWALFAAALLAFEILCFVMFDDYKLGNFVHAGVGCLVAGSVCALPTSLLAFLVLRQGYMVAPVSTGAAVGLGAGLVGLTVLEFHCPIQTFPHVAVWHTAIFVVSAAFGALGAWLFRDTMQRVPKSWANKG